MSKLDLANLLSNQIENLSLNRSQLVKKAGISRQTLYKLLNAEIDEAKLSTLVKLSSALQLHPLDVMRVYFNASTLKTATADNTGFIGDITYPDNSIVSPNQVFTKIWAVRNIGDVVWRGRRLICVDDKVNILVNGEGFNAHPERGLIPLLSEIEIPETHPNETVELKVEFKAPSYPCTTVSYWKSIDSFGNIVFPEREGLSCLVNVVAI